MKSLFPPRKKAQHNTTSRKMMIAKFLDVVLPWKQSTMSTAEPMKSIQMPWFFQKIVNDPKVHCVVLLTLVIAYCIALKVKRRRRLIARHANNLISVSLSLEGQIDQSGHKRLLPNAAQRTLTKSQKVETISSSRQDSLLVDRNFLLGDQQVISKDGNVSLQSTRVSDHETKPTFEWLPMDGDESINNQMSTSKSSLCDDSSYQHSYSSNSASSYQKRRFLRSNSVGSCATWDSASSSGDVTSQQSQFDEHAFLTIYFASQSGTSAYYAAQMHREGLEMGFDIAIRPVRSLADHILSTTKKSHDQTLRQILVPHQTKRGKHRGRAVFLVSTYHEGGPTDDAKAFVELLQSLVPTECLRGLRYSVFGFGDSGYGKKFNMQGKLYDKLLEDLGGRRMTSIGLGDNSNDLEYEFETFKWRKFWPKVSDLSQRDNAIHGGMSGDESGEPTNERTKIKKSRPHGRKNAKSRASFEDPEGHYTLQVCKDMADAQNSQDAVRVIHPESRHLVQGVDCHVKQVTQLYGDPHQYLNEKMKATNSIVHVEFDVSPSRFPTGFCELKYDTGDNICIIPVNSDSVVEAVSSHLDTHLDAIITITPIDSLELFQAPFPTPCSLREYLSFYCELGTPPPRSVIRTLSRFASIPREKEELRRLSASKSLVEYTNRIVKENIGIADLLTQYFPSIQIPLVNFIRICTPLRARWYSISSSALVDPYSLSITCSVLSIPRKIDDSIFNGICSHYLANLKPNDTCRIIKMGSSGFVPPRDPLAPLIMICNGTGIAPFRAILLELYHKKVVLKESLGKVLLFHGVRSKLSGGVLFLDELNTFLDYGVLSDLYLACSRDQPQKIYVQHLIAQNAEMIWRLLYSGGCHLYVCGASEMIKDVDEILRITAARFMEKEEIENFMENIENEHRYVREGWTKKLDISLPFS